MSPRMLPTPAPQPSGAATPQKEVADSAAAAAAGKKRFEEQKRRLEGGDRDPSEIPHSPDQTFFVSPVKVNLLIGESQPFCAFDLDGKTLTAQAEWTISSSSFVATLPGAQGSGRTDGTNFCKRNHAPA